MFWKDRRLWTLGVLGGRFGVEVAGVAAAVAAVPDAPDLCLELDLALAAAPLGAVAPEALGAGW